MNTPIDKIKVNKEVKILPTDARVKFEIVPGEKYYICYGNNIAWGCIVTEILAEGHKVSINVPIKPLGKKGVLDQNGNISHDWFDSYCVFSDEIGRTPEEAVNNTVTL
ncbi:hypothetical protein [uncultured Flavobacterium sp.]|uniref:hypothetical protein n=1 Tax=uncultured Flavobacterium sp. TaxID=165435 RepID=UPI002591E1A2|nr:hypothetical protein [uncultured Flavobacterium sp.]